MIEKERNEFLKYPTIREAKHYHILDHKLVQCNICYHRCKIKPGKTGVCKDRINIDGKLYVLTYGDISSISCNPMEKKPFFHFYPGTYALTVGSWSCNFLCPWCQNYDISKYPPNPKSANFLPPEKFMDILRKKRCSGTSFSFNEPTVSLFEYSLDVMPLAKKNGFYNTYVTNGYMTPEALRTLKEYGLDAMNIDIKGCDERAERFTGGKLENVWKTVELAYKLGIHVELTTLVIPGVNDSLSCIASITKRILKLSDENIPWHLTRYYPAYKAFDFGLIHETPVSFLEKARDYAISLGLKYVYLGNVPRHPYENTYCPECGELLIERYIFSIVRLNIVDNKCPRCGTKIPIIM